MTLYEITQIIEGAMSQQPNCGTIIRNDMMRLNETQTAKYVAFGWTQFTHRMTNNDFVSFSFRLYCCDRLTEDRSNEVLAQSAAISALKNVVNILQRSTELFVSGVSFTTFIQKFTDLTAGAYCDLTIDASVSSNCPEDYTV